MSIKPDTWIRFMAQNSGMIEPFTDRQIRTSEKTSGKIVATMPLAAPNTMYQP